MPTPNETITNSPPIAADRVRSSRIQNVCPDEVASAENADWRESEDGQQQPPDPPSCPPSFAGSVNEEQQRTHREDEKATAVPTTSTVHNNRHERDPQSEPSPTAEHKAFPQRTPSSSSTGPRDSPHVPSLNYDFSSKRVCEPGTPNLPYNKILIDDSFCLHTHHRSSGLGVNSLDSRRRIDPPTRFMLS
jgi:hypothetical protein